ncbi:hypothetical protein Tco_0648941 [Tanacetum coccineum]
MRRNQGIANDLGLKDNDPSNNKLPTNFTSASHLNTLHPRNNNLRQANDHENFLRPVLSFKELSYAQISNVGKRKQSSFGYSQCLNSVQKADQAVDKSVNRNQLLPQTQHVSTVTSETIPENKRSRGRPRKDSIDNSIVVKKTKLLQNSENQLPALPITQQNSTTQNNYKKQ